MIFDSKFSPQASLLKLLALGLASVVVYFFTLSAPYLVGLAAFPLVVATTYYNRPFILCLISICCLTVFAILHAFDHQWAYALFPLYLTTCAIALIAGEILRRNIHPAKAIWTVGLFLVALVFVGGGYLVQQHENEAVEILKTSLLTVQRQIEQSPQGGVELQEHLQQLIDRAQDIVISAPVYVFISLFLGVWLNLYLILRGHKTLRFLRGYPYKLQDLTRFSMPPWTAYLAIGVLVLYVAPQGMLDQTTQLRAGGLVYILGTFFFLQGFGVYVEYLDFLKIRGFFRNFLIVITAVFAYFVLAGVGLFDMWFDFKKFFKHKNKGKAP